METFQVDEARGVIDIVKRCPTPMYALTAIHWLGMALDEVEKLRTELSETRRMLEVTVIERDTAWEDKGWIAD